jgi:hypothetical protein
MYCHAECGDDARKRNAKALGLSAAELDRRLTGTVNVNDMPLRTKKPARKTAERPAVKPSEKTLTATYNYHDEQRRWLYSIDRFEQDGEKTFRPWVPTDDDGNGVRSLEGVRRVLYRLHRLADLPVVFLVEGEKCVHALAAVGLAATTSPGGAEGWRADFAQQLRAQRVECVIIIPDNDAAGQRYADDAARDCLAAGLRVHLLQLPDLNEKEDVADWLERDGTAETLLELAAEAPEYAPPPQPTASLFDDFVFAVGTKRFINVHTLEQYDKEQFDALHAVQFPLRDRNSDPASIAFLNDANGRRVATPTYRPGADRFVEEDGQPAINFYRRSRLEPMPGDVTRWLQHARPMPTCSATPWASDWTASRPRGRQPVAGRASRTCTSTTCDAKPRAGGSRRACLCTISATCSGTRTSARRAATSQ